MKILLGNNFFCRKSYKENSRAESPISLLRMVYKDTLRSQSYIHLTRAPDANLKRMGLTRHGSRSGSGSGSDSRNVVTYVSKMSARGAPSLSVQDRLNLVSLFESMPASAVSAVSTHRGCGKPTKEDARLFEELDYLFTKGGDEKDSASSSVIIGAIIRNAPGKPKVFIKLSFGREQDLLYYERIIYCKVTGTLLKQYVTPCVVPFIGYVAVKGVFDKCGLSSEGKNVEKICNSVLKAAEKPGSDIRTRADLNTAHALITEMTSGNKLIETEWDEKERKYVDKGWMVSRPSQRELQDVWFQIVYTLAAFGEIGLTHFDLHAGNVFVDVGTTELHTIWILGKNRFRLMSSRLLAKIYDFDRSYKVGSPYKGFEEAIVNKPLLTSEWNRTYGNNQNIFDPRMDYVRLSYVFATATHQYMQPEFLDALLRTINYPMIHDDFTVHGILSHTSTLCYSSGRSDKPCQIDPWKSAMYCPKSPKAILQRDYDRQLVGEILEGQDAAEKAIKFATRHSIPFEHIYALPSNSATRTKFIETLEAWAYSAAMTATANKAKEGTVTRFIPPTPSKTFATQSRRRLSANKANKANKANIVC